MVSFGNLNKVQLFVEPLKLEALDISFNIIWNQKPSNCDDNKWKN